MLADRVFDHRLVGGDDECGARGEHEQPDRLERLDRGVGQAAVEVVNQDDELLDPCPLEEIVECLAERLDLLGNGFRLPAALAAPLTPSSALASMFFSAARSSGRAPSRRNEWANAPGSGPGGGAR